MEGFKDLEAKLDYENFQHDLQVALKVVKDPKCTWAGTFTHINANMDKIATAAHQAPDLHIPDKFKRLRTEDTAAVGLPSHAERATPERFRAVKHLLLDWNNIVYTVPSVLFIQTAVCQVARTRHLRLVLESANRGWLERHLSQYCWTRQGMA
jgi:hypothetical protein